MFRTRCILVAVSLGLFLTASTEAWAQGRNRSVSRPALSPYLNMFRNDVGFTDPYNSMVRPYLPPSERVRRDATAPMDRSANPQASPELMRNRAQTQGQKALGIAPTGTGSVFMNMGHFYPTGNNQAGNFRR